MQVGAGRGRAFGVLGCSVLLTGRGGLRAGLVRGHTDYVGEHAACIEICSTPGCLEPAAVCEVLLCSRPGLTVIGLPSPPPQVPPLAAAKDTTRLRKHVSLVLERLARGMRLVAPGEAGGVLAAAAAGAASGRQYREQEPMGHHQEQQQQQLYDGHEVANGAGGVGARVMVMEGEEDGEGGGQGGYGGGYGGGYEEGM